MKSRLTGRTEWKNIWVPFTRQEAATPQSGDYVLLQGPYTARMPQKENIRTIWKSPSVWYPENVIYTCYGAVAPWEEKGQLSNAQAPPLHHKPIMDKLPCPSGLGIQNDDRDGRKSLCGRSQRSHDRNGKAFAASGAPAPFNAGIILSSEMHCLWWFGNGSQWKLSIVRFSCCCGKWTAKGNNLYKPP